MLTTRAKVWLWIIGVVSFLTLAALDRNGSTVAFEQPYRSSEQ